ncbi:MAG: DUF4468 domain-containing protein [Bacteroidota bacterium]
MKTTILFLALMISCHFAKSQSKTQEGYPYTYTDTVSAVGKTKDQLYLRAKEYFATNAETLTHKVTMDDKEAGRIISNTVSDITQTIGTNLVIKIRFTLRYTFAIAVKDGKYKYVISDIDYKIGDGVTYIKGKDILDKVIVDLKKFMENKSNLDF